MGIKAFFQRAYDWLGGLGRYIKKLVLDIFTGVVKDFVNKLGPTIEEILKEIQADPSIIADEDRRKAAFDRIVEAAKAAGITVGDSIIYMAIEMILQSLKNNRDIGENVGAKSTKTKAKKKA